MSTDPTTADLDKVEQLGPPSAEFCLEPHPVTTFLVGLGKLLAGAVLLGVGGRRLHAFFVDGIGVVRFALLVTVFGFLLFVQGLRHVRAAVKTCRLRVLVFPEGMVVTHGQLIRVFRWDQVRALIEGARPSELRSTSLGGVIRKHCQRKKRLAGERYHVVRRDGVRLVFGDDLPGCEELAEIIRRESLKALLPAALASLSAGEFLPFGALRADRAGLHKGGDFLAWEWVKAVQIDARGQLTVRTALYPWLLDAAAEYTNLHLLRALAQHLCDARHNGRRGSGSPARAPAPAGVDGVFAAGYTPPLLA
jgi:hypothetical protein